MGTLQIPALARGNKPHIVQSEGAEGQGRGSPWLQTQREGTQSGGRGTDPFPRREGRRLGVAEASLLAPGASCQDCEPLNPEFPVVKLRVPKPPASAPQGTGRFRTGLQGPFLRPLLAQARSCPHHQQTHPESGQHRSPHLLSGHCPLPSFWPSGCQQAHLKIHVSILAPHWKPALAAAREAPPPSASFLSLVQPQAASLAGKGKPECGHRALALVEGAAPPAPCHRLREALSAHPG